MFSSKGPRAGSQPAVSAKANFAYEELTVFGVEVMLGAVGRPEIAVNLQMGRAFGRMRYISGTAQLLYFG